MAIGRYSDELRYTSGRPVVGASVLVLKSTDGGAAALFTDEGGGTPADNPIDYEPGAAGETGLDDLGNLTFYASADAPGPYYDVVVTTPRGDVFDALRVWVEAAGSGDVAAVAADLAALEAALPDTYVQAAIATETPGATVTLDLSDGKTRRYVTLEEDTTLAVDNDDAQPLFLVIVDTGDGGFDLTFWDGIQWATEGGAAPTVTPEAESRDVFSFIKLGVGDYLGFVVGQGLAIPVPPEAPDAPTSIVATAGNTTVDVAFTPGDDGGSARTGCRITPFSGATAQTPQVFATTATTQTVTGLTNGTAYTFKVEDKNAVGYSALSTASNSVTPAAVTAPGAPTGAAGTKGNAQVSVAFTPPASNGGSAITGYTATSTPGSITASGASSPIVVTGLTNGTSYTFTVHATNAIGDSAESSATSAVVPATTPGIPTIGTATAGDTTATANWTAPASNGGSAITGYTVKTYDTSGTLLATDTTGVVLTFLKTGLTNGTAVKFKVQATNAEGTGTLTGFSNTVTPAAAAFTPASLTDLKFWGESDSLGLADNASVASWTDLSGQGHHLTDPTGSSRRPIYKTSIIDGLDVVRFGGANYLQAVFSMPQPWSLVVAAKATGTTDQDLTDGASPVTGLLRIAGGSFAMHGGSGLSDGGADTGWHIFTAVFNGASSMLHVDGGAGVTGDAGSGNPGGVTVGSRANASVDFTGDMLLVLVVGHALSTTEKNNLGNYVHDLAPVTLPAWVTVP